MNVALIGASGNVGSRILKELSDRGIAVTAIARDPARIARLPYVVAAAGDVFDATRLAAVLKGHDVVVSAVHFSASDPRVLIDAVKASGAARYVVVGGAGSLEVAPGVMLVQTPDFPPAYQAEAMAGVRFLELLRAEKDLDWTFLSPSAVLEPGRRTGQFRLGGDQLLVGEHGSRISMEDFAIALVDEIERPAHSRRRFTIGY